MFGEMETSLTLELSKRETLDEAAAKLLKFTESPNILRWIQFLPRNSPNPPANPALKPATKAGASDQNVQSGERHQ